MRYFGGKARTAHLIAGYIHNVIQPQQAYYEPFCGACWVTARVHAVRRYASDAHPGLIAMWQALQGGWVPPTHVSEDQYNAAKQGAYADKSHLEAFIGFACSFGARWFKGYARGYNANYALQSRNFALEARDSVLGKLSTLHDVQFSAHDYSAVLPPEGNMLIYCDPPYVASTQDYATGAFDTPAFWRWAQQMHHEGHTVIVSEYTAPSGWTCVYEMPTKTSMRTAENGRETRVERLFRYGAVAPLQPLLPLFD